MSLHLCSDGAGSLGLATVRRTTATAAGHDTHPVVCPVSRKTKKKSVKTKNKKKEKERDVLCSTHIWRFAEPFVIGSVAHGRESKSGRSSRAGGRAQRKTESVLAQDKTTRWLKKIFFVI